MNPSPPAEALGDAAVSVGLAEALAGADGLVPGEAGAVSEAEGAVEVVAEAEADGTVERVAEVGTGEAPAVVVLDAGAE